MYYLYEKICEVGLKLKKNVIIRIETISNPEYPQIVWTKIYDSMGNFGIGETSFSPETVQKNTRRHR